MGNRKALFGLSVLVVLLLLAGCSDPLTPSTRSDLASHSGLTVISTTLLPTGVVHETGVLGRGALYEIHLPPGWDGGDLVLYVHGYVNPHEPPALPDDLDESVVEALLARGFAIAYSSFSETGWAVRDGSIRTRQLLGHFKDSYGTPEKTYLAGASQGGLIALSLAEQNPNLFDGLLSIVGLVGGGRLQLEYLLHTRVIFDQLFGPVLAAIAHSDPGGYAAVVHNALGTGIFDADASRIPAGLVDAFADEVLPEVVEQLLESAPMSAVVLATMTVDDKPLFNWPLEEIGSEEFWFEIGTTIGTVLWFNIYGTQDILARTNGHSMIDNSGAVYENPFNPPVGELLNATVERVSAHPAGTNYLRQWYEPTGRLRFPVVTVHLTRDPAAPILHELAFAELTERAGTSGYLYQHEVDGFGHEKFEVPPGAPPVDPPFESHMLEAFERLVVWVRFGIPPGD